MSGSGTAYSRLLVNPALPLTSPYRRQKRQRRPETPAWLENSVEPSSLGLVLLDLPQQPVPVARLWLCADERGCDLADPASLTMQSQIAALQAAARVLGRQLVIVNARSESDLETAFASFSQRRVGGVLIGNSPFYARRPEQLAALAARHALLPIP